MRDCRLASPILATPLRPPPPSSSGGQARRGMRSAAPMAVPGRPSRDAGPRLRTLSRFLNPKPARQSATEARGPARGRDPKTSGAAGARRCSAAALRPGAQRL
jgi:hypothetical protein